MLQATFTLPPGYDAVTYSRISADDTHQGLGTSHQDRTNEANASRILPGVPLVKFQDDEISAFNVTKKRRDAYQDMLRHLRKGRTAAVFSRAPDRLHRNTEELEEFIRIGTRFGINVFTETHGRFDLSTPEGVIAIKRETVNAEGESLVKSHRMKSARKRAAENGTIHGGTRSFGWGAETGETRRKWSKKNSGEYEIAPKLDFDRHNPGEAETIRYWADQILKNNASLHSLEKWSRENGVKTVFGNDFDSGRIKNVLISPRASGHTVLNGEIVSHGALEPIISEADRTMLVAKLTSPNRPGWSGGVEAKNLASGIVWCGKCGTSKVTIGSGNSKPGGATYVYYRCDVFKHMSANKDINDEVLLELIDERLAVLDRYTTKHGGDDEAETKRDRLSAELSELEAEHMETERLAEAGDITPGLAAKFSKRYTTRKSEIEAELSALTTMGGIRFEGIDSAHSMSLDQQRVLLRTLFQRVTFLPSKNGGRMRKVDQLELERTRVERIERLAREGGEDELLRLRVDVDTSKNVL
ncbi:recombinase family protein [Nocardiopsis sp. NPDC050513]|uniref:recombinase family protein n=1 Tax=Nocardiopsis sp. NPDC050513 TaxID=3364338 RepID=UPI0037B0A5BD